MDLHGVLGVQPGASQDEIKKSFRRLALQWHPDRHAGASDAQKAEAATRFKAITEAYEVLTDDRKRTQYEAGSRRTSYGSASSTAGGSYQRSQHYYRYQNVNTDWAKSKYDYSKGARLSWFQQLQRAVGARKLEAGALLLASGLMIFSAPLVDAIWTHRNSGRGFEAMQAQLRSKASSSAASKEQQPLTAAAAGESQSQPPNASSSASATDGGSAVDGEGGMSVASNRPKRYVLSLHGAAAAAGTTPVGCTSGTLGPSSSPAADEEAKLAALPLAELLKLEEQQSSAVQQSQRRAVAPAPSAARQG